MKKINKIKLNELSKNELDSRQMKSLRGGSDFCKLYCGTVEPSYADVVWFWYNQYK